MFGPVHVRASFYMSASVMSATCAILSMWFSTKEHAEAIPAFGFFLERLSLMLELFLELQQFRLLQPCPFPGIPTIPHGATTTQTFWK